MMRVVAAEYVSLDGVMEDPGPTGEFEHRGWTMPYWNDELAKWQTDQLFASDALLLGRVTYEEFVAAWPLRSGDPFTDRMNSMPKYVASRTLDTAEWNARLIKGNVPDEVATLKQQPGQDILIYGSATLVQALMEHGLIDVYRLMVYPVVLGSGERLFKDGAHTGLRLVDSQTTSTGVALLTYQPARRA